MIELNKSFIITQEKGIHFRSVAKFTKICQAHDVQVILRKEESRKTAESSNTMGILLLGIIKGDNVNFNIKGVCEESVKGAAQAFKIAFAS